MKKYISAILVILMLVLGLSACGGNRDKTSDTQTTKSTTAANDEDDAPLEAGKDDPSENEGDWIQKFY